MRTHPHPAVRTTCPYTPLASRVWCSAHAPPVIQFVVFVSGLVEAVQAPGSLGAGKGHLGPEQVL